MSNSNVSPLIHKPKIDLSKPIPIGARNDTLFRFGCALRSEGHEAWIIRDLLHYFNQTWTEEPLEVWEVDRIAESVARYPKGTLREYPELNELIDEPTTIVEDNVAATVIGRLNRTLLGDALREGMLEPEVFEEDLLLTGKVHQVFAGPGSGKSWLALWLATKAMERGQTVLYLDMENGKRIIAGRLQDLGVSSDDVDGYLNYYGFPALDMSDTAINEYVSLLDELEPDLIVFDSWVNFLAASGLEENSNTDVECWSNAYVHPARTRECTVVLLDHIPHEGNHSRGATRKKDMVDVQWRLKKVQDFDRTQVGYIELKREKDREGWLPERVGFSIGRDEHGFTVHRSEDSISQPTEQLPESARKALETLHSFGEVGAAYSQWRKAIPWAKNEGKEMTDSTFRNARTKLMDRKLLRQQGNRYYAQQPSQPSSN